MNVAYKFVADKLTNIYWKGTEPSKCQANFVLDFSFLLFFLLWSVGKEIKQKVGKISRKKVELRKKVEKRVEKKARIKT